MCKPDPIFYSNRAACYNALGDWDKVVEDTTAAIALDSEYVKALNRRANAYEHLEKYSEALLDYTASCIIDSFRNDQSAQSVERLLKKVAESKAKDILTKKDKKLPSPTFVTNYLQSFRPRPSPAGLEETAELDEGSGKGQLKAGLIAMATRTGDGYEAAASCFDKALELGDLGEYEAFAFNMRGTFRYLRGENTDALEDLSTSVKLQPSLTQSFIKRASMHLELGRATSYTCNLLVTDSIQETGRLPPTISSKPWNRTRMTQTSTTTGPNSTSYSASSPKLPKTTKSRLTWIGTSSSLTYN
jgi:import receptor subunit TOM70